MRYKNESHVKKNGAVYTPNELAEYLASNMKRLWTRGKRSSIRILDPAIGDGELVLALLKYLQSVAEINEVNIVAFEVDSDAIETTKQRITKSYPESNIEIHETDFIEYAMDNSRSIEKFDMIIANPPYIRTQILGSEKAQKLSRDLNISGRLDLYYAFLLLSPRFMKKNAIAGFITSNKFMSIKSGESVRRFMTQHTRLLAITDFGDTKLFDAAVLPCTLIFTSGITEEAEVEYTSIYENRKASHSYHHETVFDSIRENASVLPRENKRYQIKRGVLSECANGKPWVLSSPKIASWKNKVSRKTWKTFSNIGKIRVGVKTTADKVFIKQDWSNEDELPELLYPLITHRNAGQIIPGSVQNWSIVYPHTTNNGRHAAVDISLYPKTKKYLEKHRSRLESRKYVIDSGRNWYEIWVPQNPEAWKNKKIVFRDISEKPQFWLDDSGAIVNGDCYWIDIFENTSDAEICLALAVANSKFIEEYYDAHFNTKLYAGKRRFMSQYVEQFPIPYLENPLSAQAIDLVRHILDSKDNAPSIAHTKQELDDIVYRIFC